jgi:predicted MPP superfamily phosphohydrolase
VIVVVEVAAAIAAAGLVWGWFEAGWLRVRELEVELPALPEELDGLRIAHLSDFHLGIPSRGGRAVGAAVRWAVARRPDLVCVTGDLLSHPRGERRLRELLGGLEHCYAILGNHDIDVARDPFSKGSRVSELGRATLLADEAVTLELHGRTVRVAGLDPASRWREPDLSAEADLRILLAHFPEVLGRLAPGRWDLVLAGHLHDGQICLPYPGGKLRLAHPRARYTAGLYRRAGTTMHVSPGLGTTFVPLRLFARPEATELTLRSAR